MHTPWGRRSGFPDPPLEPPSAVPFRSGPSRAVPKPTLEVPGSPQDGPEGPQALPDLSNSQGRPSKNVGNICIWPSRITKNSFFHFSGGFVGPLGHALVSDLTIQTFPMAPKSVPDLSQRPPWEGLGPPRAPQTDFSKFASKKETARPPKLPPKDSFLKKY